MTLDKAKVRANATKQKAMRYEQMAKQLDDILKRVQMTENDSGQEITRKVDERPDSL